MYSQNDVTQLLIKASRKRTQMRFSEGDQFDFGDAVHNYYSHFHSEIVQPL